MGDVFVQSNVSPLLNSYLPLGKAWNHRHGGGPKRVGFEFIYKHKSQENSALIPYA